MRTWQAPATGAEDMQRAFWRGTLQPQHLCHGMVTFNLMPLVANVVVARR